jgi:phage gp29-like protein
MPIPDDAVFKYKNNNEKYEQLSKENEVNGDFATTVKTLKDSGFKVDATFITEKTGIPITEIEEPEPVVPITNDIKKAVNSLYGGVR